MKNLNYLLLAALLLFANCGEDADDDDNNNTPCTGSTMTINFDGSNSTQTVFNNTYAAASQGGENGFRLDLRTNVNGGTLVLSVANWQMHNPPADGVKEKKYSTQSIGPETECTSLNGYDYCDAGLITFVGTGVTYFSVDEGYDGFVDIDDCNNTSKFVTGTFDAKLVDFISEDTIEVSGSFSNLCYTVL